VIASANTPAQRIFFIPVSPQQFEWAMAGRYLRILPRKRTKCGQNVILCFYMEQSAKLVNAAACFFGRGVHKM
jgi:hypothetical protein